MESKNNRREDGTGELRSELNDGLWQEKVQSMLVTENLHLILFSAHQAWKKSASLSPCLLGQARLASVSFSECIRDP